MNISHLLTRVPVLLLLLALGGQTTHAAPSHPAEHDLTVHLTAARVTNYGTDGDDMRVALGAPNGETMIDDFEGPAPLSHWYFGGGSGTTRSLTLTTGHAGQGARLTYDLALATPAEAYVWANRPLDSPVSAPAIAFWVKSPPGIYVKLWVSDETEQTLQYPLVRPFGKTNPETWYRHVVKLDPTPEYWGGANDGVLHGAIHSFTIVASDLSNAKASGAIDFDEVALINPLQVYLNPYVQTVTPAPAGSGDLASRLAVNIHFPQHPLYTQDDRALDAARSAGFTWVRMDLPWAAVETSAGVYDFTPWDTLVAHLQARGMSALFILDQGNILYTGGWQVPPTTPSAIQAFGAYVEAAATHYAGQPVQFEIWNEPNLANFWPPAANADQYTALAQEAITHIHQGNSSAQVSTAGLSGFDFPFLRSYLATGCASAADAIGIHPYGVPRPELVSDNVLLMRSIVSQMVPADPPIWDTEWGYTSAAFGDGHSSQARARQAIMVSRELLSAWAMGFPLIVYYDIRDDGTDPNDFEHNFGLLANDYSEKPAMQAVRTMTTAASGRTLVGFIDIQPTSLHALRLDGADDVLVALWSDAPGGQVNVTVPLSTTAINYLGTPLSLTPGNGGLILTIRESEGPVYLTFPHQNPTSTFRSVGANDGWILESAENSTAGGTLDKTATTFNLGDDASDKQYRAILHFNTATLPDTAVITKVTLKIKKQGLVGTNPFTILGGLKVDMRKPYFGANAGLVIGDFQAAAGKSAVATFSATPVSNWYSAVLSAAGRAYVNLTGTTQFRLRFATDDNNDNGADYMKFFSGNATTASARPTLVIEYYVP